MIQDPFLSHLIQQAIQGGNDSLAADLDPVTLLRKKRFGPDLRMLPDGGAPPIQAPVMPPGQSPIESQLMALLTQRQPDEVQLYQPPMPRSSNERDVGGRGFLSGLVGGINSRIKGQHDNSESQIKNLLLAMEQQRRRQQYVGSRGSGMGGGATSDPGYEAARVDAMKALAERRRRAAPGKSAEDLALEAARTDAAKALAERRRRPDHARVGRAGGKGGAKGGAPGEKDISSPVSQYFRNMGEQLKAALPDDASYAGKRDAIDAWVAKQIWH